MAHFTIADLERLAVMEGQGGRNVPARSQSRSVNLPDFRVDIRRDIYKKVVEAGRAVTRAEIAKAVGKKKTTWLNDRIEDLHRDGFLRRECSYWKNGVVMYYYSAAG